MSSHSYLFVRFKCIDILVKFLDKINENSKKLIEILLELHRNNKNNNNNKNNKQEANNCEYHGFS